MLKKKIMMMSVLVIMLIVSVGCSSNSTAIIEEHEKEVMGLEKIIEDTNKMLVKSKELANLKVAEIDTLTIEKDLLNITLKDSQDKLMALEVLLEEEPLPLAVSPFPGMTVLVAATNVLDAMRTNDYLTLASYVDPVNGVYVSPYQYIDFSYTLNLSDYDILNLATIPTIYPWGNEPASGDLISLNMLDYYNEYIYDEDYYLAPIVGMNIVVSSGNMTNNITASFPTADTVEFLFPQFDPSYGGLDWSSITLVFNTDSGMPMLLGIVHGQWTP